MKKIFLICLIAAIVPVLSFGQTTKEKMDQVKKDPATVENSAKADARLIDKKNITDSTVSATAVIKEKETACKSRKKKKARIN